MLEKIVISDTSCLIVLSKKGELGLLARTFEAVVTTKEVAAEFGEPLPDWIKIEAAPNSLLQIALAGRIGLGESSAIAMAATTPSSIVLLDDQKARKAAAALGIRVSGTLGLFFAGQKTRGRASRPTPPPKTIEN